MTPEERSTVISSELTVDPLARGYSGMTAVERADSMNKTIDRPGHNTASSMIAYMSVTKHSTNDGDDTSYGHLLGRVKMVAEAVNGGNPFGRVAATVEPHHIAGASTWLVLLMSPHFDSADLVTADLPYGYMEHAGVWSVGHSAAIQSLSESQQCRASELGLGSVSVGEMEV